MLEKRLQRYTFFGEFQKVVSILFSSGKERSALGLSGLRCCLILLATAWILPNFLCCSYCYKCGNSCRLRPKATADFQEAIHTAFNFPILRQNRKMLHTDLQYESKYRVRAYEIDSRQRMTMPALSRLMQEAALQNVIEIGMSFWDLEPHQVSWVLNRQQIHIKRMPKMNEQIRVHTTPAGFLRLFTLRDYRVYAESGELIAHSPSVWLLMNTETRGLDSRPPFLEAFNARMPPREQCFPRPKGKIPAPRQADFTNYYRVHWHDLDFNEHLNNTLYIQWMLDPLPAEVLSNHNLTFLDINYRAECQLHDELRVEVQQIAKGEYLHSILRLSDEKMLANARTIWEQPTAQI